MNDQDVLALILQHWDAVFLYGLKYLHDMSKAMQEVKKIVEDHEKRIIALQYGKQGSSHESDTK